MKATLPRVLGFAVFLTGIALYGLVTFPTRAQAPVPTSAFNVTRQGASVVVSATLYDLTSTTPLSMQVLVEGNPVSATLVHSNTSPLTVTILVDSVAGGGDADAKILSVTTAGVISALQSTDAFTIAVANFIQPTKPDHFDWAPQVQARGLISGLNDLLQLHVFGAGDARNTVNDASFTALYDLAATLQGEGHFVILVTNGVGLRYRPLQVPSAMLALKDTVRAQYVASGPANLAVTNYVSAGAYYTVGNPSLAGLLTSHILASRSTQLVFSFPASSTSAYTAELHLAGLVVPLSVQQVPPTPAPPTSTPPPTLTPAPTSTASPPTVTPVPTAQPFVAPSLSDLLPFIVAALFIVVVAVLLFLIVSARKPPQATQNVPSTPAVVPGDLSETSTPTGLHLRTDIGSATDSGKQRDTNEDAHGTAIRSDSATPTLLLVVADGMGGVDAGEVASALTVQSIKQSFNELPATGGTDWTTWLQQAIQRANTSVAEEAQKRNNQMGSTLVVAVIHEAVAYLASVGDSRIYRWNPNREAGKLARLTRDHSMVQRLVEMGQLDDEDRYTHPDRNMILRSIGDVRTGKSDIIPPLPLQTGDWLILCSDGLWEMVRDHAIQDILNRSQNAQEACDKLVAEANKKGGEDNITVVIAHFTV